MFCYKDTTGGIKSFTEDRNYRPGSPVEQGIRDIGKKASERREPLCSLKTSLSGNNALLAQAVLNASANEEMGESDATQSVP